MVHIDPMYDLINTIFDNKEVVIFLGGGASMEGKRNGQPFPDSETLIEDVIKKFGNYVPQKKRERIDLFVKITKKWEDQNVFSVRLREFLDGEPGQAHYLLAALSIALLGDSNSLLYLTTNLDNLMKRAFSDLERNPVKKFNTVVQALRPNITGLEFQEMAGNINGHIKEGRPVILKLFGDLNSQCPVFMKDDLKFEPEIERKLIEWMRKPMIVIGYSFSDKIIMELFHAARGRLPVFLVNPSSKKIPDSIKNLKRVHHIKQKFSDFVTKLLEIFQKRNPSLNKKVYDILRFKREWTKSSRLVPVSMQFFPDLEIGFVGRADELKNLTELVFEKYCKAIQIVGFGGEGKTSLAQKWIQENIKKITLAKYQYVIGCSFYKAGIGVFINHLYNILADKNENIIDIATKVAHLKKILANSRVLLILDGFEVVQNEQGDIKNYFIKELVNIAMSGKNTILVTTRVPIKGPFNSINLSGLHLDQAVQFLELYNIKSSRRELAVAVKNYIGTHALSVRLVAGFLKCRGLNVDVLENVSISTDIPEEADPLSANKASRVLKSYESFISKKMLNLISVFSLFRKAAKEALVIKLFQDRTVWEGLKVEIDNDKLRSMMTELKELRFIMEDGSGNLTCHPLVREYFSKMIPVEKMSLLHKQISNLYLNEAGESYPQTLDDAFPLIEACYHSARAHNWTLFHEIFYHRINRGMQCYLGLGFGAWEEHLALAKLTYPDENINLDPLIFPGYHQSLVALSLRRLGRNREAAERYLYGVRACVKYGDDAPARQINNLLYILTLLGKLESAAKLIPFNLAAISWIDEPWYRDWQLEHAYSSFGKLAYRLGNLNISQKYFLYGDEIRTNGEHEPNDFHSLVRTFHADTLLAIGPAMVDEAEKTARNNLELGLTGNWVDVICGSYRTLASVSRFKAKFFNTHKKHLEQAKYFIDKAFELSLKRSHLELEIEIVIEKLKWHICSFEKEKIESNDVFLEQVERLFNRAKELIYQTGQLLNLPDILAVKSFAYHITGDEVESWKLAEQALNSAMMNGEQIGVANRYQELHQILRIHNIPNCLLPASISFLEPGVEKKLNYDPEYVLSEVDKVYNATFGKPANMY